MGSPPRVKIIRLFIRARTVPLKRLRKIFLGKYGLFIGFVVFYTFFHQPIHPMTRLMATYRNEVSKKWQFVT